ncbi:MAG: HAMP domain-containing histidine kinase [Propionibacteriaceae bacterium]|jgi:signal transduction histidine kinase|nr:HAMP domain-containing histidine kinase [Propionibacteriaceae bacterium]
MTEPQHGIPPEASEEEPVEVVGGRYSLRARLTIATATVTILGLVIVGTFSYIFERSRVDDSVEESLRRAYTAVCQYLGYCDARDTYRPPLYSAEQFVKSAVNRSANATDECTFGFSPGPTITNWGWSGDAQRCGALYADTGLMEALMARVPDRIGASADPASPTPAGETPAATDAATDPAATDPASTDPAASPTVVDASTPTSAITPEPATTVRIHDYDHRFSYFVAPVVDAEGTPVGAYAVVNDRGAQLSEINSWYLRYFIPISLGAIILVAIVAWFFSSQIVRPLRSLNETMQKIKASNDRSLRVPVSDGGRESEVGALSTTFNELLDYVNTTVDNDQELLDIISGQLQRPLTEIKYYLEEEAKVTSPSDYEHVKTWILGEVKYINHLVDSLGVLSRIKNPGYLRKEKVDIVPFVDALLDKSRALGQRDWRFADRVEATIWADPIKLEFGILEIVRNAVDFSKEGSPIEFRLSTGPSVVGSDGKTEPRINLTIADHGRGIVQKEQARVWDRFERLDPKITNGAGLGLPIAKEIVEAHNGDIELGSTPGVGTNVTVSLPILSEGA